jgi:carbamoyl-phosphate synthase small subunit
VGPKAILALADGSVFRGHGIGASGEATGEVVFNTAMTGYQEIITDPSYARQLVTLTFPHIGNTGCNAADEESAGPQAAGLIVRDVPALLSNWRSEESLGAYLERHGVVGIAGIDTRRLTRILREKGAQGGAVLCGDEVNEEAALAAARAFPGMQGQDLAREVSTRESYQWQEGVFDLDRNAFAQGEGQWHVVAYDFGIKRNILRILASLGCRITVVPATTPASEVLAMAPHGVFLSNGPGDPEPCGYAIDAIKQFLQQQVPLFGICLGHQLLALAAGGRTLKMKFGHHGANHPVQCLASKRVFITSQNHGFAVDEEQLPEHIKPTHRSLFDGSLQGIELGNAPAYGFQGHPEASPGPHDIKPLFERFITMMKAASNADTATGT